jgi:DNA polymerase III alpha subunit
MFQDLAGYSAEEADYVRELVGKKKKQDMEKILPDLRERLAQRGWTEEQAQVFINLCISSARYSFNRAHSASYGYVAYISAYLKIHHPKEWWTAVLQNSKIEDIRDKGYARELQDILVLPHINGPMETFEARSDGKVHSPMWMVKGIGEAACRAIQDSRKDTPFVSIQDFFERIDKRAVNEGVFKKLIIAGAFDGVEPEKPARTLLKEYLLLKKASSLKSYGANKSGKELREAVDRFASERGESKDIQESMSDFPPDDLALQIAKISMLPIYRMDVHCDFKDLLSRHITYGINEDTLSIGTTRGSPSRDGSSCLAEVHFDTNAILARYQDGLGRTEVAWAGILDEKSEFRYVDKKTQKQVSALRMKVVNSGDAVECILWPDMRRQMKEKGMSEPEGSKILICIGSPKPSRVPGQWTISVNRLIEV